MVQGERSGLDWPLAAVLESGSLVQDGEMAAHLWNAKLVFPCLLHRGQALRIPLIRFRETLWGCSPKPKPTLKKSSELKMDLCGWAPLLQAGTVARGLRLNGYSPGAEP